MHMKKRGHKKQANGSSFAARQSDTPVAGVGGLGSVMPSTQSGSYYRMGVANGDPTMELQRIAANNSGYGYMNDLTGSGGTMGAAAPLNGYNPMAAYAGGVTPAVFTPAPMRASMTTLSGSDNVCPTCRANYASSSDLVMHRQKRGH